MSALSTATLAAYINTYGPVADDGIDEVLRLAEIVVERREAYWQGRLEERRAFKEASLAICTSANWHKEAEHLSEIARARVYRAKMLDPSPRPGDYPGREAS